MRRQFVRPQIHTQVEGDCAPATRVGGLYGMDVEGGNEDLEMEQSEFEGFEGLDAENPSEAQEDSTEAHDARIKPSPVMPTAEEVAKHDATHCPFRSWCTTCVAAVQRRILIRDVKSAPLRWVCQWYKWIMTSWGGI